MDIDCQKEGYICNRGKCAQSTQLKFLDDIYVISSMNLYQPKEVYIDVNGEGKYSFKYFKLSSSSIFHLFIKQ